MRNGKQTKWAEMQGRNVDDMHNMHTKSVTIHRRMTRTFLAPCHSIFADSDLMPGYLLLLLLVFQYAIFCISIHVSKWSKLSS